MAQRLRVLVPQTSDEIWRIWTLTMERVLSVSCPLPFTRMLICTYTHAQAIRKM